MTNGDAADLLVRYLLELDDESFFSLYRNYRGLVETPYNKHDLITDLRDFLLHAETQARMRSMLDATDLLVLSAVEVLRTPDEARLARFVEAELAGARLRSVLLNLRDRLLIITVPAGRNRGALMVNPILTTMLRAAGMGPRQLVGGRAVPAQNRLTAAAQPWLTPLMVAAFAAFLHEQPDFFTRSGAIRKRTASRLEECFGELFSDDDGARRLRLTVHTLDVLGLVLQEEDQVLLREDSWGELATLPDRWIQALLWGAALTGSTDHAASYADLILQLARTLPVDREYELGEMIRLLQLTGEGMHLPIDRDTVIRMGELGVLAVADEYFRINPAVPTMVDPEWAGSAGPRVQANMELTVPPGTRFRDALLLSRLAQVRRHEMVTHLELTEEGVARARRLGIDEPETQLAQITGELPQNVRFLLARWNARTGAVRLRRGLVLSADEPEAVILEQAAEFHELLRATLAPGVYLVRDEPRRLERLLARLELGGVTSVEAERPVDVDVPDYERLLQRFREPHLISETGVAAPDLAGETPAADDAGSSAPPAVAEEPTTELLSRLEQLDLSEDVRQELRLRIERRLILFPDQIRGDVVPQYGTEARGLDYLGKIRLIEQAISNGDMLEVIMRGAAGAPQRLMVQPREVVEQGDDLMLRARQDPEGQAIRIRIRRISLVRRLSGTLLRRSGL